MKKAFELKLKAFFIISRGLSVAKNYLSPESAPSMILAKFLKNILQLLTGLQFDICYVIKTILATIHLLFKIVLNLKISKNSQEYLYCEVICL